MKYPLQFILLLFIFFPYKTLSQSSGTGFLISNDGYIVTCYHVVEEASSITVKGMNSDFNKIYDARIVAKDEMNDLAILKVNNGSQASIQYSVSWDVTDVGQDVFTLGYPLKTTMGEEIKLTNGIISSKSGFRGDITTYQVSVPVQPGNSGGPLFDKNGFVIGVINAKHTGAENAGYAVKTNILRNLIESAAEKISLPQSNHLLGRTLPEQAKLAGKDVVIIEVDASSDYMAEKKPFVVKTRLQAKIKEEPGALGNVIGYIPKDVSVRIVGIEENYWKVFYKGKLGYSHEMYFEENYETVLAKETDKYSRMPAKYQNNNEITTVVNSAKMKIKPHVLGDVISQIPKGEIIYVVGFQDGFWKIYYNGKEGFLMDGVYFDATYEMMRFKS